MSTIATYNIAIVFCKTRGVSAGFYVGDSADTIYSMAEKAECSIIVVEDGNQLQKVLEISRNLTQVKAIVQYRGELVTKQANVYTVGVLQT